MSGPAKLYRTSAGPILEVADNLHVLGPIEWDSLINRDDLGNHLDGLADRTPPSASAGELIAAGLLAPIGTQEVWAAGVTYLRSRDARIEESQDSGGSDHYRRVYHADRPELFYKASPHRIGDPGQAVRVRHDSSWNVPEPELVLFITTSGQIVGYTIGNDVSSRSIEAENPLYLPQAKIWDRSASLGPCLYVPPEPLPSETTIAIQITRNGREIFQGLTQLGRMKRSPIELATWLTRECSFPSGVFLMTGTGIVPPDHFNLEPGDLIQITIPPIGVLVNRVELSPPRATLETTNVHFRSSPR